MPFYTQLRPCSADSGKPSRAIATQSGGTFHHAADATQLGDLFMQFVDTLTVIDLLGTFGSSGGASTAGPPTSSASPGQPTSGASASPPDQVTGLLGQFKSKPPPKPAPKDDPPP